MANVIDHFKIDVYIEGNCKWTNATSEFKDGKTEETLISAIAHQIARNRLGPTSINYKKWCDVVMRRSQNDERDKEILWSYLIQSIGDQSNKAPANQIQAVIAECLWHAFTKDRVTRHGLPIKIEDPSITVTDSGGDGLAVYSNGSEYSFRLWESKKQETEDNVTSKITEASKQLSTSGTRYLAQYASVNQHIDFENIGLSEFYGRMVENWIDRSEFASAGVSITKIETASITSTPIGSIKTNLRGFDEDEHIEALIINLPDVARIADKVREVIWSGI